MTLGPYATPAQVQEAVCSDAKALSSLPITEDSYSLAASYYGWRFGTDPTSALLSGGC